MTTARRACSYSYAALGRMSIFPLGNSDGSPTSKLVTAADGYVVTSGASHAVVVAAAAYMPILVLPPWVGDDLVQAEAAPNVVTPDSLRRVLSSKQSPFRAADQTQVRCVVVEPAIYPPPHTPLVVQAALVLRFCLSDVLAPGGAAANADQFAAQVRAAVKPLTGVRLIPTAAGTLAPVRYVIAACVWLHACRLRACCSKSLMWQGTHAQVSLLPSLGERFVSPAFAVQLGEALSNMTVAGTLGIRRFDPLRDLASALPHVRCRRTMPGAVGV